MHRFDKKQLTGLTSSLFEQSGSVRFQDVDAAGIVFFARFFDYIHEAYEGFLARAGHPLAAVIREKEWAAPLRHAEADYLAPLAFGDSFTVRLAAAEVEDSEISLGWVVMVPRKGKAVPACVVQTVHTFVSLPDFQRAAVPPALVKALQGGGE